MKRANLFFLMVTILLAGIYSCSKYPGFKKGENGIYYKFYEQNEDSLKADTGLILTLNIQYRLKINGKDSIFFNSKELAKPFQLGMQKPQFKGDVFEAFSMLHQGDSATFILNAKDFFTKTAQYPSVPEGVDSTTSIFFDVKVLKVESLEQIKKDEEAKAQKLRTSESGNLKAYIASQGITVEPSPSGIYYMEDKPGTGRPLQNGDMVKMNFTISSIDGKKVFSSLDRNNPITFEYGKQFDTKGFEECVAKMKKGTKAHFIVPSEMAFGERGRKDMNGNEIIAPYATMLYEVEILDIQTKAQVDKENAEKQAKAKAEAQEAESKEPGLIKNYLKERNITVKPVASGLYYVEKVKGKGPKAIKGKKVSVHYTGRLLDGTIFDSSLERKPAKPYEFTLGNGEVIAGWDEGIAMMNEGGKATLIIPSKLGYGSSGSGGKIKPFSPLVFDVELVKVLK
jgi:FKBP-type peptidyl-prolyl cis-trans isomerase